MNLLSGVLGVIFAFEGRLDLSFYLMLAAGVFDFCDGLSARALKAYSNIGKELDSLADLISFGLLPAIMLNRFMVISGESGFASYVPLAIVVFSALRLAKFNVDTRQSENFIGLATPACAIICGSLIYYASQLVVTNANAGYSVHSFLLEWCQGSVFIPVLSVILSLLLVSEIPMFSMKIKKGGKRNVRVNNMRFSFAGIFIILCFVIPLMGLNWSMIILLTFVCYILLNLINAVIPQK